MDKDEGHVVILTIRAAQWAGGIFEFLFDHKVQVRGSDRFGTSAHKRPVRGGLGIKRSFSHRLQQAMMTKISNSKLSLSTLTRALDTISPLATLDRGYSILHKKDHTIIHEQKQVKQGEQVFARLAKGQLTLRVEEKK